MSRILSSAFFFIGLFSAMFHEVINDWMFSGTPPWLTLVISCLTMLFSLPKIVGKISHDQKTDRHVCTEKEDCPLCKELHASKKLFKKRTNGYYPNPNRLP